MSPRPGGEIFKEVRGMVDKPVSADELQKARTRSPTRCRRVREQRERGRQLLERLHLQPRSRLLQRYAEQVNAVTPDQALAVSKKYLVPGSMVVVAWRSREDEPELRKSISARSRFATRKESRSGDREAYG